MIYKIEKFYDGYKCIVSDSLLPELTFFGRTRSEAIKMATRFVFHKTNKEVYQNIVIQDEQSKGYSF
ncbi:MAG: hypothetical protein WCG60_01415 [bacterium]